MTTDDEEVRGCIEGNWSDGERSIPKSSSSGVYITDEGLLKFTHGDLEDMDILAGTGDGNLWEEVLKGMATELLQLRGDNRKAAEARTKRWEDAPDWARWSAGDRDGTARYYDIRPTASVGDGWWHTTGRWQDIERDDWIDTLEERP